jgi:vibriolysin
MNCSRGARGYVGYVAAVLLAAACGADPAEPPIVTEPVRHVETGAAQVSGDLQRAAIDYARSVIGADLSSGDDFVIRTARTGNDGLHHIRLQQVYRDVPVRASEIVVHADDSTFISLNGTLTRNLGGFDVTPAVSASRAVELAQQHHAAGTQASPDAIRYERESSQLVIMPGDPEGAELVWHIEFLNELQPGVEPGRWHYFVDARAGEVKHHFNGLAWAAAQASGPGGNARVSRSWAGQLDVEEGGDGYVMETERFVTYDMEGDSGPLPETPATSESLEFDVPEVNDAHGFTEIVLDMLQQWLGYDSIDGAGFVIINRVNYGLIVGNAAWNGRYVTFGVSDDGRYPFSGALDVVAHEIAHGFTEFHSDLIYQGMSGGLNESFSDIAGTMAEFFHEGDGADFYMGEDAYVAAGGMSRDMCDPTSTGHNDYYDNGIDRYTDVHSSSGIGNKAFCLSVARYKASSGGSTRDAVFQMGKIWFEANASFWTPGSTLTQGCEGTVDAARALGFSQEVVTDIASSWADVGVQCADEPLVCNNDGACDVVSCETCFSCAADCGACAEVCGFFKRVKCQLGTGDCTDCPGDRGCGDGICEGDETDENCGQDCGCAAEGGQICGGVAPFGCFCDTFCHNDDNCCADIGVCR